ncbi:armadillo-type protein [Mrakia frigida]|uniref:armadillo-type protein n=1 Tax=Mrakia frigida TaxID=29902 RepID=UPI003FCC1061
MNPPLIFPSYLLSHALSTAHYSFLKRVESATSSNELDSICSAEVDRLRTKFAKGKLSDASAKEALLLLMNVEMVSSRTQDLSFGLVPALNLAEGGKDIRARQMGYLYLNENLTSKNEISLLLFNTILKDLQSAHLPSIALALKSNISTPSPDIAPAVEHQLTHLVSHKSSNIRRLALAALLALSDVSSSEILAGLKERKVWKRLDDPDPAVIIHAVRALSKMECSGLVATFAAFPALLLALRKIMDRPSSEAAVLPLKTLQLQLLKTLERMLERLDSSQRQELAALLHPLLQRTSLDPSLDALTLPLYSLIPKLSSETIDSSLPTPLLPIRRALLSSQPNGHLWALRCLAVLPASVWADEKAEDGGLGEEAMGVLMGGLESRDGGVRVETLKILQKLSPELPLLQLRRIIALLQSSASSSSVKEKQSFISRALEIVELLYSSESSSDGSDAGTKVWEILEASQPKSKVDGVDASRNEVVLEEVAGRVLGWVGERLTDWKTAFVSKLLESSSSLETGVSPSPTSMIVVAAVACEYPLPIEKMRPAEVRLALGRLLERSSSPSIQEALLISLVGVCARLEDGRPDALVVEVVESLRKKSGKHLRHRCDAFLLVASSPQAFLPLAPLLVSDSSLPNVLQTFESHAGTLLPPPLPRSSSATSDLTASPSARTKDLSVSTLRFDAYPTASAEETRKKEKKERKERREREREERRRAESERARAVGSEGAGVTAGELALLGLEEGELEGEETPTSSRPNDASLDDPDPFQVSPTSN